jgi:hypothetical protein
VMQVGMSLSIFVELTVLPTLIENFDAVVAGGKNRFLYDVDPEEEDRHGSSSEDRF